MKIIKMEDIEIISENEFTKIFKYKDNVEIYLSKAVDEETDKHFLVASIPQIKETNTLNLSYPSQYDTIEQRDSVFNDFDLSVAKFFIEDLIQTIKNQNKINQENQNSIDEKNENKVKQLFGNQNLLNENSTEI
jgi:hypothetical protein